MSKRTYVSGWDTIQVFCCFGRRDVYTDRLIAALLAVLNLIKAPVALGSQLSGVVDTVQVAVVAAVSAVMALLLLTAIIRQRQVRQKTRALTYTGTIGPTGSCFSARTGSTALARKCILLQADCAALHIVDGGY